MNRNSTTSILLAQFEAFHPFEETLTAIQKLFETYSSNIHLSLPYSFITPFVEQQEEEAQASTTLGLKMLLDVNKQTFTETIAIKMLTEKNIAFTLIGTKAERTLCSEAPTSLNNKLNRILASPITPIVCVGDTWEEFSEDNSKEVIKKQLAEILGSLADKELTGLHILYDAPWILQTPWESSNEDLLKGYRQFNEVLEEMFDVTTVSNFKLIYSVPTYSEELQKVIESLPADGYFLGSFTGSLPQISDIPNKNLSMEKAAKREV